MAQERIENTPFNQILRLVDNLSSNERDELLSRLEFRSWDEKWDRLKKQLSEQRTSQGLPLPSDEDIHAEIDARRSSEAIEMLKREIAIGLAELDRGEGIPAEQVFADLRSRYHKNFKNTDTD